MFDAVAAVREPLQCLSMIDPSIDPSTLQTMRQDWDARAKENAKHYVATSRENWNSDEFLREGAEQVHELVEKHFAEICNGRAPSDMRVLEIGCGIGRMTMALSRIFGAVDFKDTYGPLTLHALWGPSVHAGFAMGQTVGAVTVGDQLHLLHTSYEPASGLLGEASSLLNAALRESPGRDPKPASARLATRRNN